MDYTPPSGATDPNADYVGKNLAAGTQGSKVPRMAIMAPMRELVALIVGAGLTPSAADLTQVLQAVRLIATSAAQTLINNLKIPGGTPRQYVLPGYYTLAVPAGRTGQARECRGAGGGGGGANATTAAGSGGGGGANAQKVFTATVATVLGLTVGASGTPGAGGASPGNGGPGGTSSVTIVSGSVTDAAGNVYGPGATFCAATGGGGGYFGLNGPQGSQFGAGGIASGGDINDNGDGDGGGYPVQIGQSPVYFLGGFGGASPASGAAPGPNALAGGNASTAAGVGGNGSSANAPGGAGSVGRITLTV